MNRQSLEYKEFLFSDQWAQMKQAVIRKRGPYCERCGRHNKLELHHRNYDKPLGKESWEDLELLCQDCHRSIS